MFKKKESFYNSDEMNIWRDLVYQINEKSLISIYLEYKESNMTEYLNDAIYQKQVKLTKI